MNRHRLAAAALTLLAGAAVAAEHSYVVFEQPGFLSTATIGGCTSGCSRQMAISGRYEFVFNGDYDDLYNELLSLGWRITVYDSNWQDSDSGELVMKVRSTIHQRQLWRRANLRRKVDSPTAMANAIYSTVPVGETVTLEFLQTPLALSGTDFTINVRRYEGDTLIGSSSQAVSPSPGSDGPSEQIQ